MHWIRGTYANPHTSGLVCGGSVDTICYSILWSFHRCVQCVVGRPPSISCLLNALNSLPIPPCATMQLLAGWYGIMDIWDDTISRTVEGSDAWACFQMWRCCMPRCVGFQFAVCAICFQVLGLYIALVSLLHDNGTPLYLASNQTTSDQTTSEGQINDGQSDRFLVQTM